MNTIWFSTIISVLIVSLVSLIGVLTFSLKKDWLNKIIFVLVSFAAGALLGDVFLHLIPEMEINNWSMSYLLLGIILFFMMEKIIHWRHCHIPTSQDHPHALGAINLIGDGVHNFIDGAMIAASFLVSIPLGIATTLAVILHEIPQEIGDFAILLYAGYSRSKALLFNFFSAILAVIGAVVILLLGSPTFILNSVEGLTQTLIPLTAGGFIYIATADLIPELKKEQGLSQSLLQLLSIVIGIIVMALLLRLE